MAETYPINKSNSQLSNSNVETPVKKVNQKMTHKNSTSTSSLDSSLEDYNTGIKSLMENEHDISFSSDINSENDETRENLEYLFSSKYWRADSDYNLSSNKKSSQSNEYEELNIKFDNFQNINSFENNINNLNQKKNGKNEKEMNENNNNNIQKDLNKQFETGMNYKSNNNMQFFPGLYLNQLYNPYINNMSNINKNISQNQMNMNDLPLLINTTPANPMNYNYQNLNYNIISYPQIQQTINSPIQKQSIDKPNNNSNSLPKINNKENTQNKSQERKSSNNKNNLKLNTNNNNNKKCENDNDKANNNSIKLNNKNFIINKPKTTSKANIKGEKQILNLDDIVTGKNTSTTVMIRNIPIKYTDKILNDDLIEFKGKYDCLYMPYDYEKKGNKGYAFINFVNPLHILYFYEKFNGRKWDYFESSKICELNCAHFQGINEIQKHAKNYRGQKKPNFYTNKNEVNENMIIPSKYLLKLTKRFPKMKYTENKAQKTITVKSFD